MSDIETVIAPFKDMILGAGNCDGCTSQRRLSVDVYDAHVEDCPAIAARRREWGVESVESWLVKVAPVLTEDQRARFRMIIDTAVRHE